MQAHRKLQHVDGSIPHLKGPVPSKVSATSRVGLEKTLDDEMRPDNETAQISSRNSGCFDIQCLLKQLEDAQMGAPHHLPPGIGP